VSYDTNLQLVMLIEEKGLFRQSECEELQALTFPESPLSLLTTNCISSQVETREHGNAQNE
jgi:hypothetical protein